MDDTDSGGDYSNEGRNYSTPTGTPAGNTQSPGGGWNGGESSTVADTSIATPERTPTAADYASGGPSTGTGLNGGGGAPNGGSTGSVADKLLTLDNASTVLGTGFGLMALLAGGPAAWVAALGLAKTYKSGAYGKIADAFGSRPPSTTVASTAGAGQAMTDWGGGTSFASRGDSRSVYGSPVIGWQGSVLNQAPAAKSTALASAPSDFLGLGFLQPTTKPALQAPQGATGEAAPSNSTGLVGLAIGLGLLAFMS